MSKDTKIHFIGIGGAGMSAIARVLLQRGYKVSGSDIKESRNTRELENMGARIYYSHHARNIRQPDVVVYSSAVSPANPELKKAKDSGLTVIPRAKMLSLLAQGKKMLAVAGTHGKTTTTSMASYLFKEAGLDPTYIIGGELNDIGSNAADGSGEYLVAEADESDGSFLYLKPQIAIVTNIEPDHLEFYGSLEKIKEYFFRFLNNVKNGGQKILCLDSPGLVSLIKEKNVGPFLSYGFSEEARLRAGEVELKPGATSFNVYLDGKLLGKARLKVPGEHNVKNALAVTMAGMEAGLKPKEIFSVLAGFSGVRRRFEHKGKANGVDFVDDYAHHPSEVIATLKSARQGDWKRVVAVFQPHRYSRTSFLGEEFGGSFSDADMVIVTDVYSAGESPLPGVSGKIVLDSLLKNEPCKPAAYLPRLDEVERYLLPRLKDGDLVLTLGAGDITLLSSGLYESYRESREA